MKNLLLIICIALFGLTSINGDAKEEGPKKIVICHIPPGNPSNAHSIEISINALSAHLAHGDSVGACYEECDLEECG